MSALKEARSKFWYSSVWTANWKIMYKDEDDTKAKVYFIDIVASRICVTEKQKLFLILMASFYFYLFGGFFIKNSRTEVTLSF